MRRIASQRCLWKALDLCYKFSEEMYFFFASLFKMQISAYVVFFHSPIVYYHHCLPALPQSCHHCITVTTLLIVPSHHCLHITTVTTVATITTVTTVTTVTPVATIGLFVSPWTKPWVWLQQTSVEPELNPSLARVSQNWRFDPNFGRRFWRRIFSPNHRNLMMGQTLDIFQVQPEFDLRFNRSLT
jgi:hypothetical protein